MRGTYSSDHPLKNFFKKFQTFFQKPLDKTYLLCYTISVNRRGHDHLPLKLSLKVWILSPVVSFPIGPSRRVCLLISPPLYGIGLVVLPITAVVFMVVSFLTAWRVAKAREYTHANKAVGRLTVDRHWQLGNRRVSFLSSSSSTV